MKIDRGSDSYQPEADVASLAIEILQTSIQAHGTLQSGTARRYVAPMNVSSIDE